MNLKALNTVKTQLACSINSLERSYSVYKALAKVAWNESDPTTERGQQAFKKLNMYRDELRNLEKNLKDLRYTQSQVKHNIKSIYENRRLLKRIDVRKVM